jgi:hypothetical protein
MAVYSYYREMVDYTSNFSSGHTSTVVQPVRNGRIKPTEAEKDKV